MQEILEVLEKGDEENKSSNVKFTKLYLALQQLSSKHKLPLQEILEKYGKLSCSFTQL